MRRMNYRGFWGAGDRASEEERERNAKYRNRIVVVVVARSGDRRSSDESHHRTLCGAGIRRPAREGGVRMLRLLRLIFFRDENHLRSFFVHFSRPESPFAYQTSSRWRDYADRRRLSDNLGRNLSKLITDRESNPHELISDPFVHPLDATRFLPDSIFL